MALFNILVETSDLAAADVTSIVDPSANSDNHSIRRISKFLDGIAIGSFRSSVRSSIGGAKASGSVTFTGDPTADETMSLANVTITAKDGDAAGEAQFDITGTAAGNASALAALVNAHSTLSTQFEASAALGVCTFTCRYPGTLGNGVQLSESFSNATASAFANGTNGTETELDAA